MQKRPVGLSVILWCEIIVAARVLLFTLPVLLNKHVQEKLPLEGLNDWFIIGITAIAAAYFFIGILSVCSDRFLVALHYLAVILTAALTIAFIRKMNAEALAVNFIYFVPLALSIIFIVLIHINTAKFRTV